MNELEILQRLQKRFGEKLPTALVKRLDSLKKNEWSNEKEFLEMLYELGVTRADKIFEMYGETEWVMPNVFPKGYLSMVAGAKGSGKTKFVMDALVKPVLAGQEFWLTGDPNPIRNYRQVLYIDNEFFSREASRRGKRQKYQLPNLFMYHRKQPDLDDPQFLKTLDKLLDDLTPKVIVLDTFSGAHSKNEDKASEMEKVLRPVAEWVEDKNLAFVMIHHVNKDLRRDKYKPLQLNDVRGSSGITKFVRAVWGYYETEKKNTRIFHNLATNLHTDPPPEFAVFQDSTGKLVTTNPPKLVKNLSASEKAIQIYNEMEEGKETPWKDLEAKAHERQVSPNTLRSVIKGRCEQVRQGVWVRV